MEVKVSFLYLFLTDEPIFPAVSLEIIGGGLIVPAVLNRLKTFSGAQDARRSLDSQCCRALGAGLFAALFYSESSGIQVVRSGGEGNLSYTIDDPSLVGINQVASGEDASVEKEHEEELEMCRRDAVPFPLLHSFPSPLFPLPFPSLVLPLSLCIFKVNVGSGGVGHEEERGGGTYLFPP